MTTPAEYCDDIVKEINEALGNGNAGGEIDGQPLGRRDIALRFIPESIRSFMTQVVNYSEASVTVEAVGEDERTFSDAAEVSLDGLVLTLTRQHEDLDNDISPAAMDSPHSPRYAASHPKRLWTMTHAA